MKQRIGSFHNHYTELINFKYSNISQQRREKRWREPLEKGIIKHEKFGPPPKGTQKTFILVYLPAHWKEEMHVCWGFQISPVYFVLPVYKQVASSSYPVKQLVKLIYSMYIECLWGTHHATKSSIKYFYSFLLLYFFSNRRQLTKIPPARFIKKLSEETGTKRTHWRKKKLIRCNQE